LANQYGLIIEGAGKMSTKKLVFLIIIIAYSAYYALIFSGLIKKDFIVEDENATPIQKAVAFISPQSPIERNKEVKEQIGILNQRLSVEQDNLIRYEEWREKAIANFPT
jgi:hypothetical protein